MPRVRIHFFHFPDLLNNFTNFLQINILLAPENDNDLLLWWPTFKHDMLKEAARLNSKARELCLSTTTMLANVRAAAAAT